MEICLKTLTPIWTGDITGDCRRIKETGIIGSLRWWYEALVRGLGAKACAPTSDKEDKKCKLDQKEFQRAVKEKIDKSIPIEKAIQQALDEQICPACQLFGCTGWARVFKLEAEGGRSIWDEGILNIRPQSRNRGWYYGAGLVSEESNPLKIKLEALRGNSEIILSRLKVLLNLVSKWGGLGAKTQHGFGVVEFQDETSKLLSINNKDLANLPPKQEKGGKSLPNLRDFFFAKIQFKPKNDEWWKNVDGLREIKGPKLEEWIKSGSAPLSPAIKNQLRFSRFFLPLLKQHNQKALLLDHLFGSIKCDPHISSKINISAAYPLASEESWELRVWGYIPQDRIFRLVGPENFKKELRKALAPNSSMWKKVFNSTMPIEIKEWIEPQAGEETIKFLEKILM